MMLRAYAVTADENGRFQEAAASRARGRYVTAIIDAVMRKQRWHAGFETTA
jgi:hypothetical protein